MADYSFTPLRKNWKFLADKTTHHYLTKWSLKDGFLIGSWAFDQPYPAHRYREFLSALLRLPAAKELLPWKEDKKVFADYETQPLACSVTSLEIFDRILDPMGGVVVEGGSGEVRGCFEESVDGFIVNNLLQQTILNEEHPVFELYTQEERRELLFKLFGHLIIGGPLCQYDDFVQPYIDVTKAIYKEIVGVQKNKETGQLELRSKCFSVRSPMLESLQNFAYVIIDPGLREVVLVTHKF